MNPPTIHAVTGAFGYSGRYIATRLLAEGREVITLTNSPRTTHPLAHRIRTFPLSFAEPDRLAASLAGVDVLYNTYWVRFNHGSFSHAEAIRNTLTLFAAAQRAGVRRVVHVSITNPNANSPLEYFAGKAQLEQALQTLTGKKFAPGVTASALARVKFTEDAQPETFQANAQWAYDLGFSKEKPDLTNLLDVSILKKVQAKQVTQ